MTIKKKNINTDSKKLFEIIKEYKNYLQVLKKKQEILIGKKEEDKN